MRGATQQGDVPANYRCHKCHKPGHWIKNCPLNPPGGKDFQHNKSRPESNKKTGIPRSLRDGEAQEPTRNQFVEEKREVPEDLICSICKGIFKDAVMIPCCGSSFCDECVRTALLESDENECPDCKEKGTSPGSLIPNRFLRNAVAAFLAESSNSLSRNTAPEPEEEAAPEEQPAEELTADVEPNAEAFSPNASGDFQDFENEVENNENEGEEPAIQHPPAEKDSESDDDDNITVTVPPAHQQSRGAAFREPPRLRRVHSHSVGEFQDSYSQHSSSSKNAQEDGEFDDENSESYNHRHHSSSKRGNHYEHSQSSHGQGISTLVGDDKGSNQNHYHSSSSSHGPSQNMPHGDSYQQSHQPPQHQSSMFNQNQHPSQHGMPPMHSHQMYPQQGPYHQPPGPYFPPNQMRPMRFEPPNNYQGPIRHHHGPPSLMRPVHDNYGMRPRPQINHLANAVTHNIQQRYGTGIIDDPLEAFNRIMREKELRKDRYRRSPHTDRRSRSFERKRSPARQYSPDGRRGAKNYPPKNRKRSRSFKSHSSKSYSRSRSRSRNRAQRGRSKSRSVSPR